MANEKRKSVAGKTSKLEVKTDEELKQIAKDLDHANYTTNGLNQILYKG